MNQRIFITGSQGYLGSHLVERLQAQSNTWVMGLDITPNRHNQQNYMQMDIRDPAIEGLLSEHRITHVVHLASVMQPGQDEARDYDIDVNGSRNLLNGCVKAGVAHLTVTSSGAAYGYHANNPEWISEDCPIRGNRSFSYSHHKRLVEEMLAQTSQTHPTLKQLILRPGTVLGKNTDNMITALFRRPKLLAIKGSNSPFVFIWDEDVANIIAQGVSESQTGIYNLAGDGALTIHEIAALLGKPVLQLPPALLQWALKIGHTLKLTRYGPDQIDFLRYRPVLDNSRLKTKFAYTPAKTSLETFQYFLSHQPALRGTRS